MVGIYKITNQINNKAYIGQSIHIEERWKEHERDSNTIDTLLYRAMRKYGFDNFSFEVLEECPEAKLNEREIYWIKFFDTFENGYNLTMGGDGRRAYDINKIVSLYKENNNIKETARLMSCHPTTVRNIVHSFGLYGEEAQEKSVEKIDPKTLQVIARYRSVGEAAIATGISNAAISNAANGTSNNCGGFFWKFTGEDKNFGPLKKTWKRRVQQLDKTTGKVINTFNSVADACRAIGKTPASASPSITMVCKGTKISAYGFKWAYEA